MARKGNRKKIVQTAPAQVVARQGRSRKKATKKKKNNSSGKGGAFAKGLTSVLKAALPFLAMLPFSTSGSGVPLLGNGQMGSRSIPGGGGSLALTAPLANSFLSKSGVPVIRQRSANSITITHREYVRKIRSRSDTDWKVDFVQQINPGNAALFTYLSRFAGLYEGFKFRKLNFVYEPSTSTTTETAIYFAVDYDPADSNVQNKDQLTSMPGSVKTTAWFQMIFNALGPNMNRQKLYNQVGSVEPVGSDEDIRLNSAGKFYIATENETSTGKSIGDLFVEYEVELMIPQLSGDVTPSTVLVSQSAPIQVSATDSQLMGNTTVLNYGKLGCDITKGNNHNASVVSHQVRFPRAGYYLCVVKISGTTTGAGFGNGPLFSASGSSPSLIVNPNLESGLAGNFGFPFDVFDGVGAIVSVRTVQCFTPQSRMNISFTGWSAINSTNRVVIYITSMDESTFDDPPLSQSAPSVVTPSEAPRKGNFIRDFELPVNKIKALDQARAKSDYSSDDSDEEEGFIPLRDPLRWLSYEEKERKLHDAARECRDPDTLDHLISLLRGIRLKNFGPVSGSSPLPVPSGLPPSSQGGVNN